MSDSRPVLLLMDFQHGIVERIADPGVVDAAGRAAKAARAAGIPVMFVRVGFRPGYPEAAASNASFGAISQLGDAMTQDHPATQVHASLEPRPDEPVIIKRRISAFSGSDLDVLLRGANADSLILAWHLHQRRRPLHHPPGGRSRLPPHRPGRRLRRLRPRGPPRPHRKGLPPPVPGHHHRRVDRDALSPAGQRSVR
jgi:hypothetical protein